jgi:hypothetical protein
MSRKQALLTSTAVVVPATVEVNVESPDTRPLGPRDDHRLAQKQTLAASPRFRRSSRRRKQRRRRRRPKKRFVAGSDFLTTQEYADYRRCSARTVERERETGCGCPYIQLGGRILYRRRDVEHYIEQNVRGLKQGAAE